MSWFITVEGPDGSGKSSLIKKLQNYLDEKWVFTKEPGSSKNDVCLKIRNLLLSPENDISDEAEIFLYLADRCQHINKFIIPNLEKGNNVISDRYKDSTFAYQCFGLRQGTPEAIEKINILNNYATKGLNPDYTIVLMVKPEIGLKRISKNEFGTADRIEQRKIDFHKRVIEGYNFLLENYKNYNSESNRKFIVINTDEKNEDIVFSEVISELKNRGIIE